jgi:hypothetical protein
MEIPGSQWRVGLGHSFLKAKRPFVKHQQLRHLPSHLFWLDKPHILHRAETQEGRRRTFITRVGQLAR